MFLQTPKVPSCLDAACDVGVLLLRLELPVSATEYSVGGCFCLGSDEAPPREMFIKSFHVRLFENDIPRIKVLMEEIISSQDVHCQYCSETIRGMEITLGEHIFVEPHLFSNMDSNSNSVTASLSSVPKYLDISIYKYILRGVVALQESSLEPNGHHVAYCWREDTRQWEFYDGCSTKRMILPSNLPATQWRLFLYTKE